MTAPKLRLVSTTSLGKAHSASGSILPFKLEMYSPAVSIQASPLKINSLNSPTNCDLSPTNCDLSSDCAWLLRLEFYHSPQKKTAWFLLFFACPLLLLVQSPTTELHGGFFASLKWLCLAGAS